MSVHPFFFEGCACEYLSVDGFFCDAVWIVPLLPLCTRACVCICFCVFVYIGVLENLLVVCFSSSFVRVGACIGSLCVMWCGRRQGLPPDEVSPNQAARWHAAECQCRGVDKPDTGMFAFFTFVYLLSLLWTCVFACFFEFVWDFFSAFVSLPFSVTRCFVCLRAIVSPSKRHHIFIYILPFRPFYRDAPRLISDPTLGPIDEQRHCAHNFVFKTKYVHVVFLYNLWFHAVFWYTIYLFCVL